MASDILTIAVDFDGTIVKHRYPSIGEEKPGAIETLIKIKEEGHRLILWTVREGKLLDEAVQWCADRGLTFYCTNKDYPEEKPSDKHYSRKLKVDLFIDDRNLGGLPSWDIIYRMIASGKHLKPISQSLFEADPIQQEMMTKYQRKKKSFWQKLFNK